MCLINSLNIYISSCYQPDIFTHHDIYAKDFPGMCTLHTDLYREVYGDGKKEKKMK